MWAGGVSDASMPYAALRLWLQTLSRGTGTATQALRVTRHTHARVRRCALPLESWCGALPRRASPPPPPQAKLRIGLAEQSVLVALAHAVHLHRCGTAGSRLAADLEAAAQVTRDP
jgi:hypothetical protein